MQEVFVPHPHNPNVEIEMVVKKIRGDPTIVQPGEPEPERFTEEKKEKPPEEPPRAIPTVTTTPPESAPRKKRSVHPFIRKLASAVGPSLITNETSYSDDDNFQDYLESTLSDGILGSIETAFESIQDLPASVTLKDLASSSVTASKFAKLVSMIHKQNAGGAAQVGRIYTGGGKTRVAYNAHSGIKMQRYNDISIGELYLWFAGVQKYEGKIHHVTPAFLSNKRF